jgi:uncharacterized protein
MEIMNLVVTGTVGVGKTTFIQTVRNLVVHNQRQTTDDQDAISSSTTVSMDFETLQFDQEMTLHLYGTPGHVRFDFMWQISIERAHAYVLLIAAHRPSEIHQARRMMNFMNRQAEIPMLMGITHNDCEGAWRTEDIALALGYAHVSQHPPIVPIDPHNRASVAQSLITLLKSCPG